MGKCNFCGSPECRGPSWSPDEELACLRRQLAAANKRADTYLAEMVRLQERGDYYERSRICHSPYAKRPILYTDTVNGEQCCVDNLWAVSTQELNAANAKLAEAARLATDTQEQTGKLAADIARANKLVVRMETALEKIEAVLGDPAGHVSHEETAVMLIAREALEVRDDDA